MNHGLTNKTLSEIRRVLERHPAVEQAILYGSRAKGTHRRGSDIDLALIGTDLNRQALSRIADEFEDGSLPYRFDLSILAEIRHAALLQHIERVGQRIYLREATTAK